MSAVAAPVATRPPTPGAGVSSSKVHVPSKRIRAWHRKYGKTMSLRAFASVLVLRADIGRSGVNLGIDGNRTASMWLASKGARS